MTTQAIKPSAHTLWVIFLLMILGIGWGLHFSLIKIAAESGLPFSGITALTTIGILIFMLLVGHHVMDRIFELVIETGSGLVLLYMVHLL